MIGISQGLTLSPLTSAGVVGVAHEDAGAASGAVNVAHQLGSSVGLSVLVAASSLGAGSLVGRNLTAYRVTMAFDAGTIMLVIALIIALAAIVYPRKDGSRLALTEAGAGKTIADISEETSVRADVLV